MNSFFSGTKPLSYLILLLFVAQNSFVAAQDETEIFSYKDLRFTEFVAENNGAVYTLRAKDLGKSFSYFLEKTELNGMKIVSSVPVSRPFFVDPNPYNIVHKEVFDDKIVYFYQYSDKKEGSVRLLAQVLTYDGNLSEAYELATLSSSEVAFKVSYSPDHKTFCASLIRVSGGIMEQLRPVSRYSNLKKVLLFNASDFQLIYSRDVDEADFLKSSCRVDNNQNIFFIKKKDRKSVLCISEKSSPTIKNIDLSIPDDNEGQGTTVSFLKNGDIMVAGIYAGTTIDLKGFGKDPVIYVRTFDSQNYAQKNSKNIDVSAEVYDKLSKSESATKLSEAEKKSLNGTDPYSAFQDPLVVETDDGFFIKTTDVLYDTYSYSQQYKDLIVCYLSKDFTSDRMTIIPHIDDGKIFAYSLQNNALLLLLGEDPEYAAMEMTEYESATMKRLDISEFNLLAVKVGKDGKVSKKVIHENKKGTFRIAPYNNDNANFLWLEDGRLLFFMKMPKEKTGKYGVLKAE